jgi:predicted acylesterase/phospholipase RssA
MPKSLRIGFAMGGGVSLGTFNGAALTQTLKLAILRGGFADVQVDCFSGASAGAMSLAVMLRGLVRQTPAQLAKARSALEAEFGDEFRALPENSKKRKDLIAAQVVQDVQEKIWVQDISIEKLLADGAGPDAAIKHTAGLLNRAAVEKIAHDAIQFEGETLDLSGKRILADRVLFGCALNNLTPILVDARKEFGDSELFLQALADGMTSFTHREMRVFDLMFKSVSLKTLADKNLHPSRWYRYRAGDYKEAETSDLRRRKAWSTIAATALASGAFPGAFEPVVLNRRRFEFGNLWPKELQEQDSHPFTYSDGGALNNEPIRECFRMASFLDAGTKAGEVERWVVFVDPNVADPKTAMQIGMHRGWRLDDSSILGAFEGWKLSKLASLDRLIPFFGALFGTLSNEARSIEGDKIFKTHKRFALRDGIRTLLVDSLRLQALGSNLTALKRYIEDQLKSNKDNMLIPVGGLSLAGELNRIIGEEVSLGVLTGQVAAFLEQADTAAHRGLWLRALAYVAVDLVMDMTGKSDSNKLVAIAPESPLPGGLLSGFGGFMSSLPGAFEVQAARYRTQQMLEDAAYITPGARPLKPEFGPAQWQAYEKEFRAQIPLLTKRLTALLDDCHMSVVSLLPDWFLRAKIRKALEGFADKGFQPSRSQELTVEFRLGLAPGLKGLELDGKGLRDRDIKPVVLDGTRTLISFASYSIDLQRWEGVHLNGEGTALRVDRNRLLDRQFCSIELPTPAQMEAAQLQPNPVFAMTLIPSHGGTTVPASAWDKALSAGVRSLEDTLFS